MKVTVAIPTIAGRGTYLAASLATCLAQPDANLEILVSDNSPGDAEALVRGNADPRVRYVRPPHFLSMAAHWDFLLGHVGGDMVTIIGDDDGVMPGGIAAVGRLVAAHGEVPIHHALANYFWPDHPQDDRRNTVMFFHALGDHEGWIDGDAFLRGAAAGQRRYLDGPMIYHNFLPMALVRRIAGDGIFFRRAIPDVYSAFAVAANAARFYSTGTMLTLSGTGARSNGASVYAGTGIADAFFTPAAADSDRAPRFASRSVPLLQLDALLEVCEHFGRPDIAAAIDYPHFLETAVLDTLAITGGAHRRREYRAVAREALEQGAAVTVAARIAARAAGKAARRLGFDVARRPSGPDPAVPPLRLGAEVTTIADAVGAVARHLAGADARAAA